MASIKRLDCRFVAAAVGGWSGGNAAVRLNNESTLSVRVDSIDTQDGSARLLGAGGSSAFVVAQLRAWSLHILETDTTGSITVTTVFGQESRDGRLKAVHSRASFLPIDVRDFSAQPSASQYYGDCEVGR